MDMQALFPVFLPKRATEDITLEDYNIDVAQNENNLNQNFSILYNQVLAMAEIIEEQNRIISKLQGG